MTLIRPAALDQLETVAIENATLEREFRETYAREIERLETERRRAYRRFNFLAALVAADAVAQDREASRDRQRIAAAEELGWETSDPDAAGILDAMTPLADAVHDERLLGEAEAAAPETVEPTQVSASGDTPAEARAAAILFALSAFEERFEELQGKSFAAQFDRTFPETPLVDF